MQRSPQSVLFRRLFRNTGWLTGSKAISAILSVAYLGIAARTLGLEAFGGFAMILAYGQAIGNFVQFQSWQLIIRFGAEHLASARLDRLSPLIQFGMWLDIAGAVLSALVGLVAVLFVAKPLGWSGDMAQQAQLFSLALLGWVRATPTGVLRLFDRFDQLSYAETATPVVRLIGAVLAAIFSPTLSTFLLVWAISEILAAAATWLFAARELSARGAPFRIGKPRGVVRQNPGLWRFASASNAAASVNLVWQQLGTLVVGASVGTSSAGIFRMAFQLAQGLAKPAVLLSRVVYPEFARLETSGGFREALRRISVLSILCGLVLVATSWALGEHALRLIAGNEFAAAAPILTLLCIAAAIELAGFALEPALLARGRAVTALTARAIGAVVYVAALVLLLDNFGVFGAAYAAIIGSVVAAIASLAALIAVRPLATKRSSQ